jgi:hypothetical protein
MRCIRDSYREGGPVSYGDLQYHVRVFEGNPERSVTIVIEPIEPSTWQYPKFQEVANNVAERAGCEVGDARIWEMSPDGRITEHSIRIAGWQDVNREQVDFHQKERAIMHPIFNDQTRPVPADEAEFALGEVLLSHPQRVEIERLKLELQSTITPNG